VAPSLRCLLVLWPAIATGHAVPAAAQSGLDTFIPARMEVAHLPGVGACIIKNGYVAWADGYGWANIAEQRPATRDTLFMLASVSKSLTATALMQLYDEGLFALDEDVNGVLTFPVENPSFPGVPITYRQLMSHASSIRDNWSVLGSLYVLGDSPIPLGQFLEDYLVPGGAYYSASKSYYTTTGPGDAFRYANVGYALAGYMVEAIRGVPFDQHCNEELFGPLGMAETSWFLADLDVDHVAMPYRYVGGGYAAYGHFGYPDYPDGRLRTSVMQLARFLLAHINGGEYGGARVLEEATVAEMHTVQHPDLDPNYGLGFDHRQMFGMELLGHSGGDQGVSTEMYFRPADGVGAILLTNGEPYGGSEWSAYLDIYERLFEEADRDFGACVSGPGAPPDPGGPLTTQACLESFDRDDDGDVDLVDFAVQQEDIPEQ